MTHILLNHTRPRMDHQARVTVCKVLNDPNAGWMNLLSACVQGMQVVGDDYERAIGAQLDAFIKSKISRSR